MKPPSIPIQQPPMKLPAIVSTPSVRSTFRIGLYFTPYFFNIKKVVFSFCASILNDSKQVKKISDKTGILIASILMLS